MNIENSPEYQEYRLKRNQSDSLRKSLSIMENETIPSLYKIMASFCASKGHDYGPEKESKEWISNMVSPYIPNVPSTYVESMRDDGHDKHIFTKKCRFCGDVAKRDAKVTYS